RGQEFAKFLSAAPEHRQVLDAFAALLADVEPLVAVIDQAGVAETILSMTGSLETQLARFAAAVNQFSGQQTVKDQKYLLQLHWAFLGLAGSTAVCTGALVLLVFLQARAVGRAHRELRRMADNLRRAK